MSKKVTSNVKEGKLLERNFHMNNDTNPIITGNCKIDENGIALGYGNFKISKSSKSNVSCFSFMFIRLTSEPKIEFGIKSETTKEIIKYDYASFLYSIRSEQIKPQISFDGIDVSIRLYIENGILYLYVNDVKINSTQKVDFDSITFFVDVRNDPNSPTILATPFISDKNFSINRENFLSFFPKLIIHFWCPSEKYVYSEFDNYVAPARGDKTYALISDKLEEIPNSNLIYFELVITYTKSDSRFKVGFTNHEITQNWKNASAFDSLPYFAHPEKQLFFGQNICYTISEEIKIGTVIGFGIQKVGSNDKNPDEKVVDENVFLIINGKEYRFAYKPTGGLAQKKSKRFNMHKNLYSFLASSCVNFHCLFNFGQKPFYYYDYLGNYNAFLPKGWSIYSPFFRNYWIKSVPDRHVLNMFCPPNYSKKSFFGITYSNRTKHNAYEVTILELENGLIKKMPSHKKGEEVMAIGFSPVDYSVDQLVGWENNSYAIHSDDGDIFLCSPSGNNLGSHDKIETGTNVIALLDENSTLSFIVNGKRIDTNQKSSNVVYPAISYQASPCFIVNFGDSPFTTEITKTAKLNEKNCKEHDFVLENNLEIHRLFEKKNGQLSVEGISYRVTLFNKLTVLMNTKDLVPFNLEVGDLIESRDRAFRGTIAGALNGRIYCYIEKYEGAFPLVETKPIDVAITYRVMRREHKKLMYPIIYYNSLTCIDVSKGSYEDLYPSEIGLSFFIGVTNRHEFAFRPIADFYNNETIFLLNRIPDSIIPSRPKLALLPLISNSDSQTRFFLSNENLLNHFTQANANYGQNKSKFKIKNNLKLLDIVKILDDSFDYDHRVNKVHQVYEEENDNYTSSPIAIENNNENYTSSPIAIENNNENYTSSPIAIENNNENTNELRNDFDRRQFISNSSNSDNDNNDNEQSNSVSNSFSGVREWSHPNNSDLSDDNDDVQNSEEEVDDIIIPKNYDWSRIKDCALIVGKRGNDIVAWDGEKLIVIIPSHTKLIMEPFYPFGCHRSFKNLKRISDGLLKGGIRYPPSYHGFCGSYLILNSRAGKRYFQSYGGCKMPPLLNYFTSSLSQKKKNPIELHRFTKINYSSLPFEFYEVDEKSEKNKKPEIITECAFNELLP